ncbi:hypothetical protein D6C77_09250 [Aureobasidium pullulans]|uniref:Mid2 domain-containing protein n=1 Tax=Aureobasidium pullulans TaxID=5580 RepID=A0AB74J2M7_AURPU|nr:hypothetical protein D6D21_03565 [Aureobasidium pullulans]TIA50367.1 hypothetical protein D6C77_09250 [Aureobasidium pullulans]
MSKPKYLSTILTLLTLTTPISTASTCYKLNGDAAYKDFTPCNQFSGATSYCCGANRQNTNATYTNDICLTNGLCLAIAEIDGIEEYNYFRESCSSASWPTSECLRSVCTMPDQNDVNGNAIMTPCEDSKYSDTWCCGKNNTDCCGTNAAITLAVTLGATASLTTSVSFASSTASASTTSSNAATSPSLVSMSSSTPPPSSSNTNSGLSTGAQAGIGVGVAIGVFALLSIAFWFLRRRRAAHSAPHENTNLMPVNSPSPNYGNDTKEIYTRPQELDSRVVGHELDPAARLGEVEGDTAFKGI